MRDEPAPRPTVGHMRHPTLFDAEAPCLCGRESDACCPQATLATLERRAPSVLAAAAAEGLEAEHFARMLQATTARRRDPVGVPDGWRLGNGKVAFDPVLSRALSRGDLPLHVGSTQAVPRAPAHRLAGLLHAGLAALSGTPDASLLGTLAHSADTGVLAAPLSARDAATERQARCHDSWLGSRRLVVDPAASCPTSRSRAPLPARIGVLLAHPSGHLADVDVAGPVLLADLLAVDSRDSVAATAERAARRRADGVAPVTGVRLVDIGRDLHAAGSGFWVAVAWVDGPATVGVAVQRSDHGERLQAQAATTAPMHRLHRATLDAVGAAVRGGAFTLRR